MQEEMKGRTPVCITCKHFIFADGPLMCNAFPEGIPDKIAFGGYDHKKSFPETN